MTGERITLWWVDRYGGDWPRDELLLYARISGVLLALLAAGALVLSRRPVVGATLIGAGALGTAIAFPWGIAAYGPAAVATVVAAVALAQRRGGRRDVRAAPAEG